MMGEKVIRSYLLDFGLNEKEVKIYLELLRTGPSTIMDIARKTDIKRSTTHNHVEELIKKGLVSQTNYGERRLVVAEDPEKLKFLLEQRKWDIQKLEKNMGSIIDEISSTIPGIKENTKMEVKYYEGKDGTSLIYKEAFSSKELRSYVNLAQVSEVFPQNPDIYKDMQKKQGSQIVRELIDNSPASKALALEFSKMPNFEYKFTPSTINLSALDVLMYDGNVALINFTDTIRGSVIANHDYYENSKAIFDFIWGLI